MLKTKKLVVLGLAILQGQLAWGEVQTSLPPLNQSLQSQESQRFFEKIKETVGITYFTFLYGPGIHPDNRLFNPNHLGNPGNDGIYLQNQVSVRYKFSNNLALDLQNRFNLFINNGVNNPNFSPFRWEPPRIGVSGKLLAGQEWSLTGAVNTDFPHFFPVPLTGYESQKRTVLFSPGMFASFKYEPRQSRWSVFSVVSPRYMFYADRKAGEPQMSKAGFSPENKPELIIALKPTLNYRVTSKMQITSGISIDYRKQVVSNWNIFDASLVSNGNSSAWRLYAIPTTLGVTYAFSPQVTIFPFISTFPIAAQRIDAKSGSQATLAEASSVGMWISGTIF